MDGLLTADPLIEGNGHKTKKRPGEKLAQVISRSQFLADLTQGVDSTIGRYNPDRVSYEDYNDMMDDPTIQYAVFMLSNQAVAKIGVFSHREPPVKAFIDYCLLSLEGSQKRFSRRLLEVILLYGGVFAEKKWQDEYLNIREIDPGVWEITQGGRLFMVPKKELDMAIYVLRNKNVDLRLWNTQRILRYSGVIVPEDKLFMFHIFQGFRGSGRYGH